MILHPAVDRHFPDYRYDPQKFLRRLTFTFMASSLLPDLG
jgi:hypothetical protein